MSSDTPVSPLAPRPGERVEATGTPRTAAYLKERRHPKEFFKEVVAVDFARQLERDLNAARLDCQLWREAAVAANARAEAAEVRDLALTGENAVLRQRAEGAERERDAARECAKAYEQVCGCDGDGVTPDCTVLRAEVERLTGELSIERTIKRGAIEDGVLRKLENERLKALLRETQRVGLMTSEEYAEWCAQVDAALRKGDSDCDAARERYYHDKAMADEFERLRTSYHRLLWLVGWNGEDEISESEIESNLHESMTNSEKMRDALEKIAAYGTDGICPYGCDTPHIARAALGEGKP